MARSATRHDSERPNLAQAVGRGLVGHCPRCDAPSLFTRWSVVQRACDNCGLKLRGPRQSFVGSVVLTMIPVLLFGIVGTWMFAVYTPFNGMTAVLYGAAFLAALFILLIHPVTGAWAAYKATTPRRAHGLGRASRP